MATADQWSWIGTGLSLVGLAVIVFTLVLGYRHRAVQAREPARRQLSRTAAGLALVQVGQAVHHRSWLWTIMSLAVIALCGTTMILLRRR